MLYRNRKAVDERDNWDSPRLESSEIDSLNDIRNKLNNHKTTIAGKPLLRRGCHYNLQTSLIFSTVFLDTVQLQHDALVSKTVDSQGGQLDIILDKLDNIAERMGQRAGSMLTSYGSDDKETWKEFRRELIAEGFSSDVLQRNKVSSKVSGVRSSLIRYCPGSPQGIHQGDRPGKIHLIPTVTLGY